MAQYNIELSDEDVARITELAKKRGVSASTIIQQAVSTEKLIADNVAPNDDLLIKSGDKFKKFTFE
jgi:predicted transcriptional regulator